MLTFVHIGPPIILSSALNPRAHREASIVRFSVARQVALTLVSAVPRRLSSLLPDFGLRLLERCAVSCLEVAVQVFNPVLRAMKVVPS